MLKVLRGMKSKTEKKPEQIRETFRGGRSPTFPPAQIEIMTRSFRKPKIILINFKKKNSFLCEKSFVLYRIQQDF